MSSRILISYPKDEPLPFNIVLDLNWVKDNMAMLYEKYGSCVIIVYQQKIIGMGESPTEALYDAESRLGEGVELITAIIDSIHKPNVAGLLYRQEPIKKI